MADLSDNTNWFETDASNNKAPPNGWPEGMMPSGVNDTARGDKGALKRFWDRINPVQGIVPAGGVWTFVTANIAYPAAYVDGEVYTFWPGNNSVGGDQFQVNALAPKPIWKRTQSGWAPVAAQDIVISLYPSLVYDSGLNGGAGAFVLLNPFVPISGDGAGGIAVAALGTFGGNLVCAGTGVTYSNVGTHGFNFRWDGISIFARVDNTFEIPIANATDLSSYLPLGGGTITGSLNITGGVGVTGAVGANGIVQSNAGGDAIIASNGNVYAAGSVRGLTLFGGTDGNAGTLRCMGSGDVITFRWDGINVFYRLDGGAVEQRIPWATGILGFAVTTDAGSPTGQSVAFQYNTSGGNFLVHIDAVSDARVKENIRDTQVDALAAVCRVPVRAFEWNALGRKHMPHIEDAPIGLVAQEVREAMPYAVGVRPHDEASDLPPDTHAIVNEHMTPYLVRAIQQLAARVIELEARLVRE